MYKVKCKLVEFLGDENKHPCHFGYKIGDEIYYDGVSFTGKICHGIMASMMPVVYGVFLLGHKYTENLVFRYRGADIRDPEMAEYDGAGFRPVDISADQEAAAKKDPRPVMRSPAGRSRGHHFACADTRILAHFTCEPIDLCDSEYAQPFYRRELAVLEKIEAEPGIGTSEILDRFSEFQKNSISPRLTPVLIGVLLEALEDMSYIEIKDGKAYATGREPPSRPKLP